MSEIDFTKLIENVRDRISRLAGVMPSSELRQQMEALGNDLEHVLTVIVVRIEKLEDQLKK